MEPSPHGLLSQHFGGAGGVGGGGGGLEGGLQYLLWKIFCFKADVVH